MDPVSYTLDLRDPARRRIKVELLVELAGLVAAGGVEFFLPAWTPGSYLIREYAKHLGDFHAAAGGPDGKTIAWRKSAKNRFLVEPPVDCHTLRITYQIYAHELSVRTSDMTDRHAFLSGAAVYLWPCAAPLDVAVSVRVQTPVSWDLATSLSTTSIGKGQFVLEARSLDELIDSPILAGQFETHSFDVLGKPHHLVLDGLDGISPPDSLVPHTTAIIKQAAAIFQSNLPYDEYKFLCMFTDAGHGGLEHLASSALLAPRTTFRPAKDYRGFMGLIAHEFFHVWNVKRMRPAELWVFDYENENHTELLWVAEGFTAYYDDHLCRRADVLTAKQYLKIVADGIAELRRTPGRHHQSLSEASHDAWIRLYRPDEDTKNSTLSYYGNGALAALCLDLRIRSDTDGAKSLDDAMRSLYAETFGNDRGYTYDDVVDAVNAASGSDLSAFLYSLVHRSLDPDFDALLAPFGLIIRSKSDDSPFLGVHFKGGTTTVNVVLRDAPAEAAGLMPQDEILALNHLRVKSSSWSAVFDQTAVVGRPLDLLISRRGRVVALVAEPKPRESCGLTIEEAKGTTEAQERLRRGWLYEPDGSAGTSV